jgi:hypothetical protein
MLTDDLREALQELPLNTAEDLARFQSTLADYAAYMQYAALMKRQLDRLMPGAESDDYWAVLDKCYGTSPLREVFREAVNREMDAEIAPLMEQFRRALEVVPASWVQRVQQSKNPLQLVRNDGR